MSATEFITSGDLESMNSSLTRQVTGLRGKVSAGTYAKGSKSQREAVFIETPDARYVLRRKSGPVFGDAELARYVGLNVECDGFVTGATLLAERIQVVS